MDEHARDRSIERLGRAADACEFTNIVLVSRYGDSVLAVNADGDGAIMAPGGRVVTILTEEQVGARMASAIEGRFKEFVRQGVSMTGWELALGRRAVWYVSANPGARMAKIAAFAGLSVVECGSCLGQGVFFGSRVRRTDSGRWYMR